MEWHGEDATCVCSSVTDNERSDLFWLTGAIDNLLQPVASLVSLQLMSKGKAVPYGVAIGCAILNIAVLQLVPVNDMGSELDDFSSEPLLPPSDVTQQHKLRSTQLLATLFPDTAKPPRSGASFLGTNRRLTLAVSIFALAGISKSTRGLFTTYVFKRYHISFSQVFETAVAICLRSLRVNDRPSTFSKSEISSPW